MNKDELIDTLEDEREKFLELLEGFTEAQMQTPGVVGEWSMKDLLAHLVAWEGELVRLLWQTRQGEEPSSAQFGSEGVDAYNARIFAETKERSLERVMSDYAAVGKQLVRRIEAFSDAELNQVGLFPWLGKRSLWEWIESDSFGHEIEHTPDVLAWKEQQCTS